jgi:hypothetical protein
MAKQHLERGSILCGRDPDDAVRHLRRRRAWTVAQLIHDDRSVAGRAPIRNIALKRTL